MGQSVISYRFKGVDRQAWHREVAAFIAELDSDPDLKGRIGYRCVREKDGDRYFHFATTADAEAAKTLQGKAFFRAYQEATRRAGGGEVEVVALEPVAETAFRG